MKPDDRVVDTAEHALHLVLAPLSDANLNGRGEIGEPARPDASDLARIEYAAAGGLTGPVIELDALSQRIELGVADAAVAGNSAKALTLARHAFATGIAPQLLVTALAMKFRAMAKVSIGGSASTLKMAPWQVDRARRELRGWSDASLAGAF